MKGLGETLVGAYPGRALSFICKKNNLDSPQVSNQASFAIRFCSDEVSGDKTRLLRWSVLWLTVFENDPYFVKA